MAVIRFAGFAGENRAVEPKLLADSVCTVSTNQKPGRGDLRSWRSPATVATIPSGRSCIYRMGRDVVTDTQYWLSWETVVHAVRGFSATDTTEQTFYTGDGYPKVTDNLALDGTNPQDNPTVNRPMGIPAPATALTAANGAETVDPDVGKYKLMIYDYSIALLQSGDKFRITVGGDYDPAIITLTGTPDKEALAGYLDAIDGISATAEEATDTQSAGVLVMSDAVGSTITIEKVTSTTESFAAGDVSTTLVQSGSNATRNATALIAGRRYRIKTLGGTPSTIGASSMTAGRQYEIQTTADTDYTAYGAASNTVGLVFTALGPATGSGTVFTVTDASGATDFTTAGAKSNTVGLTFTATGPALGSGTVYEPAWVTIPASTIATIEVDSRWSVSVNSEPAVMVQIRAATGSVPPAVNADTVRSALSQVPAITTYLDTDEATGERSVRLEIKDITESGSLDVYSVTAGTTEQYSTYLTGAQITKEQKTSVSTYYAYTYVNDFGWESAPSPVSTENTRYADMTATLSAFAAPPSGNYNIETIRIYKSQTGTDTTNFFFLREISVGTSSTEDDNRDLGEVLETTNWLPAPGCEIGAGITSPEEDLLSLVPMWNGMMAGISGNAVRVCEPYAPYAWPKAYEVIPPDGSPVGMGVWGQNLLILTTSRPVLVNGSGPDGLDQQKIEMPQGCVAPRSIVSMGAGVAWASEDGLCWYGNGGPRILTAGIMLREDWQALSPSSIIGCMYEGLYFGSYLEGGPRGTRRGFFIDPNNPQGIFFMEKGYQGMYFDELRDHLYVLDGTSILKWDAAPDTGEWSPGGDRFMTYRVKSKMFKQPIPHNFAAAEVIASEYPVTFRLHADGVQVFEKTVASRDPFWMPAGYRAMDYQIELEGTAPVQGVAIASSKKELAEV